MRIQFGSCTFHKHWELVLFLLGEGRKTSLMTKGFESKEEPLELCVLFDGSRRLLRESTKFAQISLTL